MDFLGVLTFFISLLFFIMWLYVTSREYDLIKQIQKSKNETNNKIQNVLNAIKEKIN